MYKKYLVVFSIFIVFITGCNNVSLEEAMKNVESTNLLNENISGIKLGMVITDDEFIKEHGRFNSYPYDDEDELPYELLWNDKLLIRALKESGEINLIAPEEKNMSASTEKGVKIGTPLENVIEVYGSNYYTYEDNDQGLHEIGYVDHEHNISLSFVHFYGKVTNISLRKDKP